MSIERPKDQNADETHATTDRIIAPTNTAIERAERKKEKIQDIIAENHSAAISMLRFEKLLSNTDEESLKMAEGVFAEFPAEARERYQNAFDRYQYQIKRMKELLNEFEADIEREQSYGITETEARNRVASRIYRTLGYGGARNTEAVGAVTLDLKEGYMLLKFDNHEDYKTAAKAMSRDSETIDETGGLHGHATYIGSVSDKYMGPVLLVRNDRGAQRAEEIVAHERQHFINHEVFGLFSSIEHYPKTITDVIAHPDNESEQRKARAFVRIKDEVLAYMRDGSSGTDLKNSLRSKLYTHLFASLNESQKAEAWKIIEDAADFISTTPVPPNLSECRAIIIYQLAHVPFAEFPKWLTAMRVYYRDRFEMLRPFDMYVSAVGYPVVDNWYSTLPIWKYPSKYPQEETTVKSAREIANQLQSINAEAQNIAFDHSYDRNDLQRVMPQIQQKYEEARRQYGKTLEPLMRNGILAPCAVGLPRVYKYGEEADTAVADESEKLEQIRQALLDALDVYSQENIDIIITSYEVRDRKDNEESVRAKKHLEVYLKKIVHQLNGNKPCSVSTHEEEMVPHSFGVTVDFRVDEETRKRGIKGCEMDFELRGSNLKF